ncbi:MAG: type II toxin-antitoxin system HicB family antitoxin [Candidatus Omnitrophica bacterium]|nr:type II toxin-antitoxin system HicB family antitoxin [Candidatus Omnitrophota bacterium]
MPKKINFSLNLKLPVQIIKENDAFVAYTPALDLSTQGDTYEEAQQMFEELINVFFAELIEMGTLEKVLKECGWIEVKTKAKKEWRPPERLVLSDKTQSFKIPCPA